MRDGIDSGRPLVSRVKARMASGGDTVTALAERLGISQAYLSQLLKGDKLLSATNDELIREMAAYLVLPPLVCFILAGKLQQSDFFGPGVDAERAFERALRAVADSSFALESGVDFDELNGARRSLQLLVILLYQALNRGGELFPSRDVWSWLAPKG